MDDVSGRGPAVRGDDPVAARPHSSSV